MITLEKIYPGDANAERYSRMMHKFSLEYELLTRSDGVNRRQRQQLALIDIQQDHVLWIMLLGKRIGFVLAPFIDNNNGTQYGRYLDTRWIEPQHRDKGYGTQVIELLEQDHQLLGNKINMQKLQTHGHWWHKRGYDHGVPCFSVDTNMAYEKLLFDSGHENIHWFLFHKDKTLTAEYKKKNLTVLF